MERHVESFLNRTSLVFTTIATILLLSIFLRTTTSPPPSTCLPHHLHFPSSTCSLSLHRPSPSPSTKTRRFWSTSAWTSSVASFSYLFLSLPFPILSNSSKSISLLSGAGQEIMALRRIGVLDSTGLDLVDSPPLVARADLFNLPFFDDVFDFAFSAQFDVVLFPSRFVAEMERVVRVGGYCVVVIDGGSTDSEVRTIAGLFRRGRMVGSALDVVLNGSKMRQIIVQITNSGLGSV